MLSQHTDVPREIPLTLEASLNSHLIHIFVWHWCGDSHTAHTRSDLSSSLPFLGGTTSLHDL